MKLQKNLAIFISLAAGFGLFAAAPAGGFLQTAVAEEEAAETDATAENAKTKQRKASPKGAADPAETLNEKKGRGDSAATDSSEEAQTPSRQKRGSKKFSGGKDLSKEIQNLKGVVQDRKESAFDKEAFNKILSALRGESFGSEQYRKQVQTLERAFYNAASFESLETLAALFDEKEDRDNQLKTLKIMASHYPENPKSHYLLGEGFKKKMAEAPPDQRGFRQSSAGADDKNPEAGEEDQEKTLKERAVESFGYALKIEKNYEEAYISLLPLLLNENKPLGEAGHNTASLKLIEDMIRRFADPRYYSLLCEAYYENQFLRQARKACAMAAEEDPKEPKNFIYAALVQTEAKDIKRKVAEAAKRFPDSYEVQLKAGLFFEEETPQAAIECFTKAAESRPEAFAVRLRLAQLLFKSEREEEAYPHFFEACLHGEGEAPLKSFRQAVRQIRLKRRASGSKEISVAEKKWSAGAKECLKTLKKRKKNNNRKNKDLSQGRARQAKHSGSRSKFKPIYTGFI